MKKLAIFVEGHSEVLFIQKLVQAIAGHKGVEIVINDASKYLALSKIAAPNPATETFILICNCEGDTVVKQRIKDNEESLAKANYNCIIGLRDLYPADKSKLTSFMDNLYKGLSINIPVTISIAVMEIEAWFLQGDNHFTCVHPALSNETIKKETKFDPNDGDVTEINHPSEFLNAIYQIVGLSYTKKEHQVRNLVDCINFDDVYFSSREKIPQLDILIKAIEDHI